MCRYGGVSDTATVKVVAPAGSYLMQDFSSPAEWSMSGLNIDTLATRFSISDMNAFRGRTCGRLEYRYAYRNEPNDNYVYLTPNPPIQLPGRIDPDRVQDPGEGAGRLEGLRRFRERGANASACILISPIIECHDIQEVKDAKRTCSICGISSHPVLRSLLRVM